MSTPLRWGILGTGNIARQFAGGLSSGRHGAMVAVGSRSADSARSFAQAYGIASAYGSYGQVLADPQVEAVYISLPNTLHHPWTLKALRAGKHVLCEKPIATCTAQAQEMFDVAEQCGRVLMEAFMYRCHPLTRAVLASVHGGAVGTVRMVRSSFCYYTAKVQGNIRFSHDLAGGALMDVGCYCINLARAVAGAEPVAVHAVAQMHSEKVDVLTVGTLRFADGMLSTFSCGMNVQADNTASLCGDGGYIEVPIPWKPPPTRAVYSVAHSAPPRMDNPRSATPPPRQTFTIDAGAELYALEADAFAAAVRQAAPLPVTAADSLGNMRVLDEMRRQISS
jgi:predicted dehydrogenase